MQAQTNRSRSDHWACPFCHKPDPEFDLEKPQFRCQRCCALGNSMTVVRRTLSEVAFAKLEATFKGKPASHPEKICPGCRHSLTFFSVQTDRKNFLGLCIPCRWVWSETVDFLNAFSRQGATVLEQAKTRALNVDPESPVEGTFHDHLDFADTHIMNHVEGIADEIIGPPITQHDTPMPAYHSFMIVGACAMVTWLVHALPKLAPFFFYDPRHPLNALGLPLILSGFMHANMLHLVGNSIAILTLGWMLENELKRAHNVLWIFFGSVLLGNIFQTFFAPPSFVIGASGGARGFLAFYCVMFPWARFTINESFAGGRYYSIFRVAAPAYLVGVLFLDFLGGWSGSQLSDMAKYPQLGVPLNIQLVLIYSLSLLSGFSPGFLGTACFAHLGGAVFGLLYTVWGDAEMKKATVKVSTAAPSRKRDGSRRTPIPSAKISGFPNGIGPGEDHLKVYSPPVRKEKV